MALRTRIFRSGNSLAVRIPSELAVNGGGADEAQIEWHNGAWIVRPLQRRSLAGLAAVFREFPEDFMAQGREFHEQAPRDWEGEASGKAQES